MIPATIHHVWVGPPMPDRLAAYVATWKALHPTWEHRLWTEFHDLENQDLYDRADEIAGRFAGQLRSDLARYEILWRHGGVYVDADMEALRPFDPLLDAEAFAGWEDDGRWVNNAVLGAVPGHPLMRALTRSAPASIRRNRRYRPNRMTGPGLLTPLVKRHPITVHPRTVFYPYRFDELDRQGGDYGDAFAVHHWDNTRKRRGLVDA